MASAPLELRTIVGKPGAIAAVHAAFGSVLDAVEPGRAVARVPALPPSTLRGPGAVPVLGDLALSAAVLATLPAGRGITTLTLHTTMLGALPEAGEGLVATAELVGDASGSALVSRADVRAVDGRPVAHLTCCCAVVPRSGGPSHAAGEPDLDPFAALGPDLRAAPSLANAGGGVQGGVLAAVLGDRMAAAPAAVSDLDVTFLRAVPADGTPMAVEAGPIHSGRRLVAARARLCGGDGRPAAVATCAFWHG